MEPRCAAHPDRPAAGTCERCGAFACAEDYRAVAGRWLCASCAARPDSNYLEAFRLKYWGKRDAWGWILGVAALGHLVTAVNNVVSETIILLPLTVAVGVAEALYFLGLRRARALVFAPIAEIALTPVLLLATTSGVAGMGTAARMLGSVVIGPLIPGLIALAVFLNTRNKLFFQVPVSQHELKKAWDVYCNNTLARGGFLLSLLGLLLPGVGALGLAVSIVGLSRVDPNAFPPIGRKKRAIAGIVLGAAGTLLWGAFFVATQLQGR